MKNITLITDLRNLYRENPEIRFLHIAQITMLLIAIIL